MTKIYSKALDRHIEVSRVIGQIKSKAEGPTIIFTGGIHGNEPSGVFALQQVMHELKKNNTPINGSIYAISGNLWALERGERFKETDLNRLWRGDNLQQLLNGTLENKNQDIIEQKEIYETITTILGTEKGPFYFMDLHTTSSETIPFLTVNDSLLNRKFTEQYPVPMILGIEEYLDGPLLSYINELGYIAFGFEAGQHDDLSSIENHVAFIYLSLIFSGVVSKKAIDFDRYYNILAKTSLQTRGIYEINYRYRIKQGEEFKMHPGYYNFQWIKKGQPLATSNGNLVKATRNGRVFMPLYQSQGDDGFFSVKKISGFFLKLSALLRKTHFHNVLPILPGIQWQTKNKETLVVNRNVAKLFAKEFFHLMGYRSKRLDKTHLIMKNREANSRIKDYT